jgi:hypothetical protein
VKSESSFAFYSSQGPMTNPGRFKPLLEGLPDEVLALVHVIQVLQLYDVVAADFYGFEVPAGRAAEIHIRPIEKRLQRPGQSGERITRR